jgi:DNA primase
MPLSWDELPDVAASDQWHMETAVECMRALGRDPCHDMHGMRQSITGAMRWAVGLTI